MAKYTIELETLLKSGFDLGLADYPIYDESYRVTLNNKLLNHYMFNEIGTETANRFKFYLNRALNEIMPYYNQLYESALLSIEPLLNYKNTKTGSKNIDSDTDQNINSGTSVNSTSKQTSALETEQTTGVETENQSSSLSINSKTPQSELLIGDIENNLYADEATKDQTTSTATDTSTQNKTDTGIVENEGSNTATSFSGNLTKAMTNEIYNMTDQGFTESQSDLLMKFRQTILNIDMLIIEDPSIRSCFMLLY